MNLTAARQLLAAYFHQDWPDEFADPGAAVAAMIDHEPAADRHAAAAELRALLREQPDDATLRSALLHDLGCFYEPAADGLTARQWLAAVADRLAA